MTENMQGGMFVALGISIFAVLLVAGMGSTVHIAKGTTGSSSVCYTVTSTTGEVGIECLVEHWVDNTDDYATTTPRDNTTTTPTWSWSEGATTTPDHTTTTPEYTPSTTRPYATPTTR